MNRSSLSELFSVEDQQKISQDQNKVLIFDGHNMAYRTLFSAIFMNPEDNEKFYFWKHMFMNSFLNTIVKFNPSKVILAFDTKGSWRYDIYPSYKSNRKIARDKAVIDFEKFFPIFSEFKDEIKDVFKTVYVLEHPKAEGDDIIAVLCKEQFKKNQNIIVSTDKDMHQLLIEKNNQQFDPINNKIVSCINPLRELDLKIITGDKSDAIPAIRPRTGTATAESILKEGIDDFLEEEGNEEYKKNYIRNRILIDFNFIPKDLSESIINTYCKYEIGQIEGSKIMNFFSKNRLNKMMQDWQNYSSLIKSLT
jgi:5'-3' exonuclease